MTPGASGHAPAPPPGALLVDARAIHASGIGRYLRELVARWLAAPPFAEVVLLGHPGDLGDWVAGLDDVAARVRIVAHDGAIYSARAQRSWLAVAPRHGRGCAAAFFPHWDAPLVGLPAPSVVTVHDLIHFKVPDAFPAPRRWLAGRALARVTARASRVIAVSETTGRDLVERLPAVADRLRIVRNGVSTRFRRDAPGVPDGGGAPYLLCVANQKPHKNLGVAVEVLARLRPRHPDLRLAVVGARFRPGDAAAAHARRLGVADAVDDVGAADDAALRALYHGAAALLFPSRYEGFGLPVLEAMVAGLPVVASDAPAVAEIAGDAALRVPVGDAAAMADAVEAILARPALRADLVARGLARAAAFSWDRAASETAAVLLEAAGGAAARPAARAPAAPAAAGAPVD